MLYHAPATLHSSLEGFQEILLYSEKQKVYFNSELAFNLLNNHSTLLHHFFQELRAG